MVAIEPRTLKPGRSATVIVAAQPLTFGERVIEIRVPTTSPRQPELRLGLSVVGSGSLPYVAASPGSIRFGIVREVPVEEPLYVETREREGSPPWITDAEATVPDVSLVGGLEREDRVAEGVVVRRYSYRTILNRSPGPGNSLAGEVRLIASTDGEPRAVVVLPLDVTAHPAVSVSPAALVGSFTNGDRPELSFMLSADNPDLILEAGPDPDSAEGLDVTRAGDAGRRLVFRVTPRQPLDRPIERTLRLRTNHPQAPEVSLPVLIRPMY